MPVNHHLLYHYDSTLSLPQVWARTQAHNRKSEAFSRQDDVPYNAWNIFALSHTIVSYISYSYKLTRNGKKWPWTHRFLPGRLGRRERHGKSTCWCCGMPLLWGCFRHMRVFVVHAYTGLIWMYAWTSRSEGIHLLSVVRYCRLAGDHRAATCAGLYDTLSLPSSVSVSLSIFASGVCPFSLCSCVPCPLCLCRLSCARAARVWVLHVCVHVVRAWAGMGASARVCTCACPCERVLAHPSLTQRKFVLIPHILHKFSFAQNLPNRMYSFPEPYQKAKGHFT